MICIKIIYILAYKTYYKIPEYSLLIILAIISGYTAFFIANTFIKQNLDKDFELFFDFKKNRHNTSISNTLNIKKYSNIIQIIIWTFIFFTIFYILIYNSNYYIKPSEPLNLSSTILLIYLLIIISYIDIITNKIPNLFIVFLIINSFLTAPYNNSELIKQRTISLITAFFFFMLTYYFSKKSIGKGDIKLLTALSTSLDLQISLQLTFISFLCCCVFSILLLLTKKISIKCKLPFAPFILFGTFITFIF